MIKKRKRFGNCARLITAFALILLLADAGSLKARASGQEQRYGIGSTSKVFVTAAVMKLSEEEKIDLDRPLTDYINEFEMADERYQKITPRMLLNHTSGLAGGTLTNAMLLGDSDTYNHDMLLTLLKEQRLKAEPGEFAVYCNDGFTLAEILVERVSGQSFTDYLQKEFASPLGLSQLGTPQSPDAAARAAQIYDPFTGKELPAEMANVIGSGGIYSTAEDLVRFSQIFMRSQGEASGILSEESARAMETSAYADQWNPEGRDSNLSYGLGWDSVDTYPFSNYGVKALVKGGDTNFYHASLTVLPEENISCAVLTSGGGSVVDQLAVQEILMTYLDEIGRIERGASEDAKLPEGTVLEEAAAEQGGTDGYAGLYAGTELYRIADNQEGGLKLTSKRNGHEQTQNYQYAGNGRFLSTQGGYINLSGNLMKGSQGRTGRTVLEFKSREGSDYLMAGVYESYPGLGVAASYLPVGERLGPAQASREALESFSEYDGKEFWTVGDKYTSTSYLTRFSVKMLASEESEGYLTFEDGALKPAKITGPGEAEFFQKLPGQAGRDLADYRIEKKDGRTYLSASSDCRYLLEEDMEPLETAEGSVTIAQTGEPRWFTTDTMEHNRNVMIEAPEKGAWYVYDQSKRETACVASSFTCGEDLNILLPEHGKIVFAGEPGGVFQIHEAEAD